MMKTQPQLAVIEDHDDLREELVDYLANYGYPIWGAPSAEAFYQMMAHKPLDILLVDLGLPGEDGLQVIKKLRAKQLCGIIAVTARGELEDRIRGMRVGADYYLVKPVDLDELEVNIQALWRNLNTRIQQNNHFFGEESASDEVQPMEWQLSPTGQLHLPNGGHCQLSEKEYLLMSTFLQQPRVLLSKELLHQATFPKHLDIDPHRIDVLLNRLRKRLKAVNQDLPLRVVFGQGIVFCPETLG